MQRSKNLRERLENFNKLKNDCEDLLTLVELALEEKDESVYGEVESDYNELKARFDKLKLQTLLKGEYDKNDAIFTLHAGAGGTEGAELPGHHLVDQLQLVRHVKEDGRGVDVARVNLGVHRNPDFARDSGRYSGCGTRNAHQRVTQA